MKKQEAATKITGTMGKGNLQNDETNRNTNNKDLLPRMKFRQDNTLRKGHEKTALFITFSRVAACVGVVLVSASVFVCACGAVFLHECI